MLARQAEPGPMTFEEYLDWEAMQAEKWELVDGYPERRSNRWFYDPVNDMAGATRAHNRIVANLIRHLGNRLAGGLCTPYPSDIKLRTGKSNARYPDVTVEYGTAPNDSLLVAEARVLFEVLSASNTFPEQIKLLDDYQATAAVQQIVWIEQDHTFALVWTREGEGWRRDEVRGVDAALELDSIGLVLPLAEVYEGLDLGPDPPLRKLRRRPG